MKKFAVQALSVILIALISIAAFAAGKAITKEISLSAPTVVGDKLLPAGSYKVTATGDTLSFFQMNVSKAKAAEVKVTVTAEKAEKARTNVLNIANNDKNQAVLVSLVFGGQQTRYIVAK